MSKKQIITEKDIKELVDEVLNEISKDFLFEDPGSMQQNIASTSKPVAPSVNPIKRPAQVPVKKTASVPVSKTKPSSQTIPGPKDKENLDVQKVYSPEKSKEKSKLSKIQYQIFNIKMRLGKLGLGDTVRKFIQSIHDFDINITKNSTDKNDIRSFLSPAQGNLIALKGALESIETEFLELEKLLDQEN